MASEFLFWACKIPSHAAQLSGLEGFDDDFEINEGVSHAGDFPSDASFTFDPDYPNDTLLVDQHSNTNSFVLVSKRVQELLVSKAGPDLELLQVKVLDHKKRDVGAPYYIVHPVGTVTCLNRPACKILIEDEFGIDKLEKVVIESQKVPKERLIFRIENLSRYVCVRRELAQIIDKASFTGIRWVEPEELEGRKLPADLSSLPARA
jgi:hypothetical protein